MIKALPSRGGVLHLAHPISGSSGALISADSGHRDSSPEAQPIHLALPVPIEVIMHPYQEKLIVLEETIQAIQTGQTEQLCIKMAAALLEDLYQVGSIDTDFGEQLFQMLGKYTPSKPAPTTDNL